MNNFRIKCKFCNNEDQTKFQTTMLDADGYSEYTILSEGFIEFKCLSCGTFGTTNEEQKEGSNKLNMFELTCNKCNSHNWEYEDSNLVPYEYCKIKCCDCNNEEKQYEKSD